MERDHSRLIEPEPANTNWQRVQDDVMAVSQAIYRSDYKSLKNILQNKKNLDFLWSNNIRNETSIVHVAAESNSLECLKYLVKRGGARALVLRDTSGWTALHYASYMGHMYVVQFLLENGSPILRDNKGKTPVYWAGKSDKAAKIVQLLIQASSNSTRGKGGKASFKSSYVSRKSTKNVSKTRKGNHSYKCGAVTASRCEDAISRDNCSISDEHIYPGEYDDQGNSDDASTDASSIKVTKQCGSKNKNSGKTSEDMALNGPFLDPQGNTRAKKTNRRAIGRRSTVPNPSFEEGSWDELHLLLLTANSQDIENLLQKNDVHKNYLVNKAGECGLTPLHVGAMIRNQHVIQALLDYDADIEARDSGGKTPLHRAAQSGNTAALRCFIKNGGDVLSTDNDGRTPLHDAAHNNHLEAVELLLQFTVDVNAKESTGSTALLLACNQGHAEIVKILLQHDADINLSDSDGQTPLHDAIANKDFAIVHLLLSSNKCSIHLRNEYGRTVLHNASANKTFEIVEMLLNHIKRLDNVLLNDILNARDEEGWSALHDAAATGAVEIAALLCENGIDINASKGDMQQPLHIAAANGHVDTVKYLLANGARANAGDSNGDTALHWAAFKGQSACVYAILNAAANSDIRNPIDPHCQNADGGTALHSAANHGDITTGEVLLDFGASVDVQMDDGNASLHNAAYEGHYNFACMLLEHRATVDIFNGELRTPLHEAACMGHTQLCRLLLGYGAGIDLQDGGGDTPLHWSVCNGHASCAKFLLDQGANMEVLNIDGGTPLHAALINNESSCIKVLLEAGAEVNAKMEIGGERSGDSCLHVAASEGLFKCINQLVIAGARINEKNALGQTPLHAAIIKRHLKAAVILIQNNADLSVVDKHGCVPLHYALGRRPHMLQPLAKSFKMMATLPADWQGFANMFDSDQFSDICIKTKEGKIIHAHKIVLCSRCPLFRAMFSHSFKESSQNTIKLDYEHNVVKMLIQFLYSGSVEIDNASPENIMECLQLADQYTLETLKSLCGCILQDSLDIDNLVNVYKFAKYHGASNLQVACIDYFLKPSTSKRIDEQYRVAKRTWLGSKTNSIDETPAPLPPKTRYKAIIHDILHRRWRTLGIKVNQKMSLEEDGGTESTEGPPNENQNEFELNNDVIENESSSSDDDDDERQTVDHINSDASGDDDDDELN